MAKRRRARASNTAPAKPVVPEPNRAQYQPVIVSSLGDAVALASGSSPPKGEYQDIPVTSLQLWGISKIKAALANHEMGVFTQSASLVESLLGDPRIQAAANGRLKGITKCDPVVEAADDSPEADAIRADLEQLYCWRAPVSVEI